MKLGVWFLLLVVYSYSISGANVLDCEEIVPGKKNAKFDNNLISCVTSLLNSKVVETYKVNEVIDLIYDYSKRSGFSEFVLALSTDQDFLDALENYGVKPIIAKAALRNVAEAPEMAMPFLFSASSTWVAFGKFDIVRLFDLLYGFVPSRPKSVESDVKSEAKSNLADEDLQHIKDKYTGYFNLFGDFVILKKDVDSNGLPLVDWEIPIYGNSTDIDNLKKIILESSMLYENMSMSYSMTDGVVDVFWKAFLFPSSTVSLIDPMYLIYSCTFLVLLTYVCIFSLRAFFLAFAATSAFVLVLAFNSFSELIPADAGGLVVVSLFTTMVSMYQLAYGFTIYKKMHHPFVPAFLQVLFCYSAILMTHCDRLYFRYNMLMIFPLALCALLFFCLLYSRDDDSSRAAFLMFTISIACQFFFLIIRSMQIRRDSDAFGVAPHYYELLIITIKSGLPLSVKAKSIHKLIVSFLTNSVMTQSTEVDVGSTFTTLLIIGFIISLMSFAKLFQDYFKYSCNVDNRDLDPLVHPAIQAIAGLCRFVIDVSNNITGFSGITMMMEVQRFNSGQSSLSGALFLSASIVLDAYLFRSPYKVLPYIALASFIAYALLIFVLNEDVKRVFGTRPKTIVDNKSIAEKLALLASGNQYIPHAFQPFSNLNLRALGSLRSKVLEFRCDGAMSNCIPIAGNKVIVLLHSLVQNLSESNIGSITARDLVNKMVSVGTSQVRITGVHVPKQDVDVPDRILAITLDKDVTTSFLTRDNVGVFSSGKNCFLFSKGGGDNFEGRVLTTSGGDVFTHNVNAVPSDSGGLIVYSDGNAVGIHCGKRESARSCVAFRLDSLWQGFDASNRYFDPKSQINIVDFSRYSSITEKEQHRQ